MDSKLLNDPATEEQAIEQYAYAMASVMEVAAVFKQTLEQLTFSEAVVERCDKFLRKILFTIESEVPTQWRRKVLQTMSEAMAEADEVQIPTFEGALKEHPMFKGMGESLEAQVKEAGDGQPTEPTPAG